MACLDLQRIDHFTLSVAPQGLPALLDFYTRVLTLQPGPRPPFHFPGHWLYAAGQPLVHLAGLWPDASDTPAAGTAARPGLDHVSLRCSGLASTRAHLTAQGVAWQEATVPGGALHQIFLHDPTGLKVELTFDAAELTAAGADLAGAR